jgi:hypothetical protein
MLVDVPRETVLLFPRGLSDRSAAETIALVVILSVIAACYLLLRKRKRNGKG